MKKNVIIGIVLIILIGVVAKVQIDKMYTEKEVKTFQEDMTEYIINNYEGINKIEWKGWRKSEMGTIDTMLVINDVKGESISSAFLFSIEEPVEEFDYHKYFDRKIAISEAAENSEVSHKSQKELRKQGVKKSELGSKEVNIIIDVKEGDIWR